MLYKMFKMTGVKNNRQTFTDRHVTSRRFIHSHLFTDSFKGSLTIDLMVKPRLCEYINKLENYI